VYIGGDSSQPLLLASDGTLYTWDIGKRGLKELTNSVVQLSSFNHTLVLKKNGSIWARGDNTYSQLGDGTTETSDDLILVY